MFKTLLGSLILKEKIKTTEAKAKELKIIIEKVVSRAKQIKIVDKKLAVSKYLHSSLPTAAAKKLTGEFIDKFSGRNGGYVRIVKLDPRKSDSAKMAIIEFVTE